MSKTLLIVCSVMLLMSCSPRPNGTGGNSIDNTLEFKRLESNPLIDNKVTKAMHRMVQRSFSSKKGCAMMLPRDLQKIGYNTHFTRGYRENCDIAVYRDYRFEGEGVEMDVQISKDKSTAYELLSNALDYGETATTTIEQHVVVRGYVPGKGTPSSSGRKECYFGVRMPQGVLTIGIKSSASDKDTLCGIGARATSLFVQNASHPMYQDYPCLSFDKEWQRTHQILQSPPVAGAYNGCESVLVHPAVIQSHDNIIIEYAEPTEHLESPTKMIIHGTKIHKVLEKKDNSLRITYWIPLRQRTISVYYSTITPTNERIIDQKMREVVEYLLDTYVKK